MSKKHRFISRNAKIATAVGAGYTVGKFVGKSAVGGAIGGVVSYFLVDYIDRQRYPEDYR